ALQEAAAAAGFEHVFLLVGEFADALGAASGEFGFIALDAQAEAAEGGEIAGGDGGPFADLNFGANAGGFDFRAAAIERGEFGGLLLVAGLFELKLDAAPFEGFFKREAEGFHRLLPAWVAGRCWSWVARASRRPRVS